MSLTDEQLNIAVAEACGRFWHSFYCPRCKRNIRYFDPVTPEEAKVRNEEISGAGYHMPAGGCGEKLQTCIPDYLTDLNAMHEVEKGLTREQQNQYMIAIHYTVFGRDLKRVPGFIWANFTATARQRASAFLRVVKPEMPAP